MTDHSLRILLVEHDPADAELVRSCLQDTQMGFELVKVSTSASCIEQLDRGSFAVVITELNLPDSRGMAAVSAIHEHAVSTPIIILTRSTDERVEMPAMGIGFQDYLEKDGLCGDKLRRSILHATQRNKSRHAVRSQLDELQQTNVTLMAENRALIQKNRELQSLYEATHSFVDNVSHEFRTPLTVVNDYVSLVREGMVGAINEEQNQMLDVVSVRVDDLNHMVDDLLDISKIESRRIQTWRRDCSIQHMLGEALPQLERKAKVKSVTLDVELPGDLPVVFCDAEKLIRAMLNLGSNAIQVADNHGTVRIWASAEPESGSVVLGVDGTGAGIPSDELRLIEQKLMQPQMDFRTTTRNFGISLCIARELIQLNFGRLQVFSETGVGTVYSFSVPVAEPQHVITRYFDSLSRISQTPVSQSHAGMPHAPMSINLLQCDGAVDLNNREITELEQTFQSVLPSEDLLIRTGHRNWLFATIQHDNETSGIAAVLRQIVSGDNKRAVASSVPRFSITEKGSFEIPQNSSEVARLVQTAANTMTDSRSAPPTLPADLLGANSGALGEIPTPF